ncbi:hypothetical protein LY474_12555 [Myxococcus stipitatus]|uniref:hypothetical protein n=1 Tax=Myxococcus stipitatus TaxID=83455 RepID=UPI001F3FC006|nr:hypothetical protein [Myxococcus stipitatus]MCE9668646.1 hypothetical protein [Myxococcus stipitatus]
MTRLQKLVAACVCLTWVACGGAGGRPSPEDPPSAPLPPPAEDTPPPKPPPRRAPGELEVRLLAVNHAAYSSLSLRVRDIEVFQPDGTRVPTRRLTTAPFELTQPKQAFLVGLFQPPAGQDRLKVRVTFDGPGGYREATAAGLVESARTTIELWARPELMRERGRVVIEVDMARSLEAHGVNRVFTPTWSARY